jgi:hypothetical protein
VYLWHIPIMPSTYRNGIRSSLQEFIAASSLSA